MRVQDPLLLTHRIDRKAEPAILKGNGLAWFCFDLAPPYKINKKNRTRETKESEQNMKV